MRCLKPLIGILLCGWLGLQPVITIAKPSGAAAKSPAKTSVPAKKSLTPAAKIPNTKPVPKSTLRVQFYKAHTPSEAKIRQSLIKLVEIQDFATFVNHEFNLRYPIQVRFGAADGPLFDLKRHTIDIPYSFMQDMMLVFQSARYERTGLSPAQAAMDTLIYVLFHELGHAFIDMYHLPLFAKEEDVADYFATTILLDSFEGGAEIAISTADMFDIASRYDTKSNKQYYWDEHSLDMDRSHSLLCHVYGSNPKRYAYIAKHHQYVRQRSKQCVRRYSQLLAGWSLQLAPYIRTSNRYMPKVVAVYTLSHHSTPLKKSGSTPKKAPVFKAILKPTSQRQKRLKLSAR